MFSVFSVEKYSLGVKKHFGNAVFRSQLMRFVRRHLLIPILNIGKLILSSLSIFLIIENNMDNIKRIISACLLALFVSYVANTTLFIHTHIVDGQLVTHSHPYRGAPDNPGHGHSSAQFQTIVQLSLLLAFAAPFIICSCFLAGKKCLRNSALSYHKANTKYYSFCLRGPPVFI